MPRIFFLDNIDPDTMNGLFNALDLNKTLVNVITKSKNIFMEFVDILENPFHRNSITLS